jgi:hypothetical protein
MSSGALVFGVDDSFLFVLIFRVSGTGNHKPGGLNSRNVCSHSSGGWKSEIQVLAEMFFQRALGEGSVQASLLAPASLRASLSCFFLCLFTPFLFTCFSLCPNFLFFFCKDASHPNDLILTLLPL